MSILVLRSSAAASSVPSWTDSVAAGFWATISTDTIEDHDPEDDAAVNPNHPSAAPWHATSGVAAVTDAWNGGGLLRNHGTHGTYCVCGAGHNDYFGSEVYGFDLSTALWGRLSNPYTGTYSWPISDGIWGAAIPGMPHTYQHVLGDSGRNRVVLGRLQTNDDPSTSIAKFALLNPATGTWSFGSEYDGTGTPHSSDGCMAHDTSRDIYWMRGGQTGAAFASYDPDLDSWTQYSNQGSESGTVMAYDPNLDILVMMVATGGQLLYGIDCSSPNTARTSLTQSNRQTVSTRPGWIYSQRRQAFICWETGEDVWEVKKGVGDWDAATWTWTNLVDGSNIVIPTKNSTGTMSRLQVVTYGSDEFLILVNETNGSVYAFKVP